jgi:hypothetical protein
LLITGLLIIDRLVYNEAISDQKNGKELKLMINQKFTSPVANGT